MARRINVAISEARFQKFSAYLNKHGFTVKHDSYAKKYDIQKNGDAFFIPFVYYKINQDASNVLALLTMKFNYAFPGAPRNSYRCPDCGCNSDSQVERGAIEGTTRCQDCYDYSQMDSDEEDYERDYGDE